MKILVTGATGFIGSRVTRQLLDAGHDRVRILRREHSCLDLLGDTSDHVEHRVGDMTDPASLLDAMQGVEVVFHTAAVVHLGSERGRRVTATGARNVVDAAIRAGIGRLIHTSSIAALGRSDNLAQPGDESTQWEPDGLNTPYAVAKHEAELEIFRGLAEGLDAVMVNPSVVFGPGRKSENTSLICAAVQARRVFMYPAGSISVVDVDDVAAGHLLAWERGQTGERYILAGENLSWLKVLTTLAEAFQVPPPRWRIPPATAIALGAAIEGWSALFRRSPVFSRVLARTNNRAWSVSNEKAVRELGCIFRPFGETAARIAAAFAENG
ncbi:MAG: SDR family oxidoreductase [Bacteroidota bacterium]|nr:SDR family oxidoreductase [Bacteroidota bacterium]MDE2833472.1 SDR family oxidoreductase [Bacteroidota bacterium]MDE2958125.1 SDR family oxidoreductase [Bacteroidota bacterium]